MTARQTRRRAARPAPRQPARGTRRFVILTGLSGSGKTHAIRALEDLGYFCVDNLPSSLIPTMAELARRDDAGLDKVAIVVDVRESRFLTEFPRVYRRLRTTPGVEPRLIFLEAAPSVLVRRFSETRRPHPLAPNRSVTEGITEEREKLHAIRAMADLIIDTSNLTVHELRQSFMRMSRDRRARADMIVTFES
ncbi:MAG TPA: RNase adapter RapZ, partial [Vicinamibacterales bacterium]|nr:RNase adapter RapZ [Vicinamibacterales bacterium]